MKDTIKKVLIIGSGPVVIGQSSEYDYAGVQACLALREEGIQVVVINSNPASIITDKDVADKVYIEPLNIDIVKRIIIKERPDTILPTMGGEKGLEIAQELYQNGFLEEYNVNLLSVTPELIQTVQDSDLLKSMLSEIHEPTVASMVVSTLEDSVGFAEKTGFPVIIRPAYSLGGKSADFCYTIEELKERTEKALEASLIHQVHIEKCISGWKELEYQAVRDSAGNCICVSSMENLDPVGIHTGDSIIVTPAQTLTDAEAANLRSSALHIVSHLGIVGGCGIQFALKPDGSEYAVLNIDPKASRSSALVSKATGYPIASVAAKVSVGYRLYEIINDITGCTTAANEPAIDYCAIKFPKWSFDSFDDASRKLGTSMQSTGETISIGTSFELAFMKAVRSINIGIHTPSFPKLQDKNNDEIIALIKESNDERIFAVYEAIKRGIACETIFSITKIDNWFLAKLKNIAEVETGFNAGVQEETYRLAKEIGFLDKTIAELSGSELAFKSTPSYKMVDTCAAEFDAVKPYFYSALNDENEAHAFSDFATKGKRKVLVIGSGASTVGQGSELDYGNVHCIKALKTLGYAALTVNNNPEAVSTDYRVSDRLFIDPISVEDIEHIIAAERPWGVILQFSGKRALELSKSLEGTSIKQLGANYELLYNVKNKLIVRNKLKNINVPYTSDHFFNATGIEVEILCDGDDCLIPGISEHIERSGIHSGDSISVYPTMSLNEKIKNIIIDYSYKIVKEFHVKGLLNIQFVLYDNMVYVSQISTGSLYNIPFISKATGLPIIDIAVRVMLGEKLAKMSYGTGLYPFEGLYAVRVPVFSFDKLNGADTQLGLEMKSTGEVLGLADNFEDALLKGLIASGMRIKRSGGVLITVRDSDKQDVIDVADKFAQLDFNLYATAGTAKVLNSNHVATSSVRKLHEGSPHVLDLINSNKVVYVISSSQKAQDAFGDDIKIRRRAIEQQIPTFTTIDTANALARCLAKKRSLEDIEIVNL